VQTFSNEVMKREVSTNGFSDYNPHCTHADGRMFWCR
jgi:hypothetical protein